MGLLVRSGGPPSWSRKYRVSAPRPSEPAEQLAWVPGLPPANTLTRSRAVHPSSRCERAPQSPSQCTHGGWRGTGSEPFGASGGLAINTGSNRTEDSPAPFRWYLRSAHLWEDPGPHPPKQPPGACTELVEGPPPGGGVWAAPSWDAGTGSGTVSLAFLSIL